MFCGIDVENPSITLSAAKPPATRSKTSRYRMTSTAPVLCSTNSQLTERSWPSSIYPTRSVLSEQCRTRSVESTPATKQLAELGVCRPHLPRQTPLRCPLRHAQEPRAIPPTREPLDETHRDIPDQGNEKRQLMAALQPRVDNTDPSHSACLTRYSC